MPVSPEIVNPVPVEEAAGWMKAISSTFLSDPEADDLGDRVTAYAPDWAPDRVWGARSRDRWVATLATMDRTVTVPGADGGTELAHADALTAVTVSPTHRRQGLLTKMLHASLRAARERGDALAILIAAEYPIYGRFGYAPATVVARRTLHRGRRGSEIAGDLARVRQVDRDEFLTVAPGVFDVARRGRPGQVDRDPPWWDRTFGRNGFPLLDRDELPYNHVLHEGAGGPDGMLAWRVTREGAMLPPRGAVDVIGGLVTADDAAHRDLWTYLSGLDGVDEVSVRTTLDDPAGWLLPDARTLVTTRVHDELWLRLLDVPAALSRRRYATPGELVLEVTDDTVVSVAGRYRLAADGPRAQCTPTGAEPDLTVAQTALSAAYLGGFSLRAQRITGAVVERRPGALQRADAMFATPLAPITWTSF